MVLPAGAVAACSPFPRLVSLGCAQGCGWASLDRRSQPEDAACRSRHPARDETTDNARASRLHPPSVIETENCPCLPRAIVVGFSFSTGLGEKKKTPPLQIAQSRRPAASFPQYPHTTSSALLPQLSCIAPAQLPHNSRTTPALLPHYSRTTPALPFDSCAPPSGSHVNQAFVCYSPPRTRATEGAMRGGAAVQSLTGARNGCRHSRDS